MIQITVNGKTITIDNNQSHNIRISNNTVYCDGVNIISSIDSNDVIIKGNCGSIDCKGSVTVNGNVTGNIDCGGSCHCGDISGDVDAGGSVVCGNVNGDVDAGGSIKFTKK